MKSTRKKDKKTTNKINKDKIKKALKEVRDPEIPVSIYDLGLIYSIKIDKDKVYILMTLTTPFCPASDVIVGDVKKKIESISGVKEVDIEITFDPPWTPEKMSKESRRKLGFE